MNVHDEVLTRVRKYPGMHVRLQDDFDSVASFIAGYHLASGGEALRGFPEWLTLRAQCPPNWAWEAIVLSLAWPGAEMGDVLSADQSKVALATLFDLLDEFIKVRSRDGVAAIIEAFERYVDAISV